MIKTGTRKSIKVLICMEMPVVRIKCHPRKGILYGLIIYIYVSLIFGLLTPPNLIKFAYPAEFLSCSDWLLAHRRAHSEGPLPNPVDSCTRLY